MPFAPLDARRLPETLQELQKGPEAAAGIPIEEIDQKREGRPALPETEGGAEA